QPVCRRYRPAGRRLCQTAAERRTLLHRRHLRYRHVPAARAQGDHLWRRRIWLWRAARPDTADDCRRGGGHLGWSETAATAYGQTLYADFQRPADPARPALDLAGGKRVTARRIPFKNHSAPPITGYAGRNPIHER